MPGRHALVGVNCSTGDFERSNGTVSDRITKWLTSERSWTDATAVMQAIHDAATREGAFAWAVLVEFRPRLLDVSWCGGDEVWVFRGGIRVARTVGHTLGDRPRFRGVMLKSLGVDAAGVDFSTQRIEYDPQTDGIMVVGTHVAHCRDADELQAFAEGRLAAGMPIDDVAEELVELAGFGTVVCLP